MDWNSALANLPDSALVPMAWVREHFVPRANSENRDMTTVELAEEFGHSAGWWQDRCREGAVVGAHQASAGSPWYVPRQEASLFLRKLKARPKRRKAHRHPWKGPQAA